MYNFLNQIFKHNFALQITCATRATEKSATLIDNIVVNNPFFKYLPGNITTSISNRLPEFTIVSPTKLVKAIPIGTLNILKGICKKIKWNFAI